METIGQRIKRMMEEEELKQEAVSEGGGLSQAHLSKLIQDKIENPSLDMLKKVARGLQVNIQQLLLGTKFEDLLQTEGPAEQVYCPNPECEKTETATSASSGKTIFAKRFYTARYDKSGKEVKHCPFCGTKMIHSCTKCHTPIFQWNATYCTGCGKKLFEISKKKS